MSIRGRGLCELGAGCVVLVLVGVLWCGYLLSPDRLVDRVSVADGGRMGVARRYGRRRGQARQRS